MSKSIRAYTKKNRAPAKGTMIGVRLQPGQLAVLDTWAAEHGGLSRPEALRRLMKRGLGESTHLMRSS